MKEIVEKCLDDRLVGIEVTKGTKNTELFRDIPDGDLYHLTSISNICEYKTGTTLVKKGDSAKELFILLSGEVKVKTQIKDVVLKKRKRIWRDGFSRKESTNSECCYE